MRAIKDDFAEYEHAKIAQRTFSKKLEKARGGEIIAGAAPTYAFRYNEKRHGYLVDDVKMPLVRGTFEMIGGEGETSRSVIGWLESADAHGPHGKGRNLPQIRKMVFNDVYRPHSFEEVEDGVPPEVAARLDPRGYMTGTTSSGTPTNDYYYRCRSRYNVKSGCTNGRGARADVLERVLEREV